MITRGYIVLWFMWTCYLGRSTMATLFCNSCASATLTLNIFPLQDDSWNQNHPPKFRHAQRQAWERSVSSSIAGLRGKNWGRHKTFDLLTVYLKSTYTYKVIKMQSTHSEQIFTLGKGVLLAREAQTVLSDVDGWIATLLHHLGCMKSCNTYYAKQLS